MLVMIELSNDDNEHDVHDSIIKKDSSSETSNSSTAMAVRSVISTIELTVSWVNNG